MPPTAPDTVIIAEGAIQELANLLQGYKRALLVTDDIIYSEYNGLIESIIGDNHSWLRMPQFNQVISTDPHDGKVIFGPPGGPVTDVKEFRDADIILGIGGGRSIDAAKLLARESGLSWISVPTAASHDGIASDVASVMHNGYRYSEKCKSPIAIVADLSIISKAPPSLELAGIGDIVCKASSLAEWKLAHEHNDEPLDEQVLAMLDHTLSEILNNYSLKALVKAEIDAGEAMNIVGSSRPCSGTEHAISHAMDRRSQNLHGIQVGFATPLCVHYLNQAGYSKYAPDYLQEYMRQKGLPLTFEEMKLNVDVLLDDIQHGLRIMEKRNRYSILNHMGVTEKDLRDSLQILGY